MIILKVQKKQFDMSYNNTKLTKSQSNSFHYK